MDVKPQPPPSWFVAVSGKTVHKREVAPVSRTSALSWVPFWAVSRETALKRAFAQGYAAAGLYGRWGNVQIIKTNCA
jgi:hypothetical protein